MKFGLFLFAILVLSTGCATKFRFPTNRMISPESVGGSYNGEMELGQQGQAEGKIDVSKPSPYPILLEQRSAMSFFGALSLVDTLDFYWSHTASAPSMVGGRWQLLGGSQLTGGAGHSLALTGAFGGNEHEIEGPTNVEFKLSATDFSLIHGYWFSPQWQIFETLAYTNYTVTGDLTGAEVGKIDDEVKQLTGAIGMALIFKPGKFKFEAAYSSLDWSNSKDKSFISYAVSLGFNI